MTSTEHPKGDGADLRREDPDRGLSRAAAPSRFKATPEEGSKQEAEPLAGPGEWWPRTVRGDPWLYKIPRMAAGG